MILEQGVECNEAKPLRKCSVELFIRAPVQHFIDRVECVILLGLLVGIVRRVQCCDHLFHGV